MHTGSILNRIREIAIVPIVRAPSAASALQACAALIEGGLTCVEITMTVPNAIAVMEQLADRFGDDIILGAGTVLDSETARACMLAGAQFLVTPSLNRETILTARRYSKPIFAGALTPTEVLAAWEAGADAIKIFPCSALGGASYIRALKGPFPQIEFVPTGGVNLETVREFLEAGSMAVGVGSELVDAKNLAAERHEVFADRARQFRERIAAHRAAAL